MENKKKESPIDRLTEAQSHRLFSSLHTGMVWLHPSGRILDANQTMCGLLGYTSEELQAMPLWELGGSPSPRTDRQAAEGLQLNGYLRNGDLPLKSKHGTFLRFKFQRLAQLENDAQLIECRFLNFETGEHVPDIASSATQTASQSLLPHPQFEALATAEIQRMRTEGQPLSLLSVSIDRYGGRRSGDLPAAALPIGKVVEACANLLRATDVIGRVDDKVFIALLPKTTSKGVLIIAERLRTAIAALDTPLACGRLQRVMASIGTVTTRTGRTSYRALRSRADAKRDDARHLGGNRVNA